MQMKSQRMQRPPKPNLILILPILQDVHLNSFLNREVPNRDERSEGPVREQTMGR